MPDLSFARPALSRLLLLGSPDPVVREAAARQTALALADPAFLHLLREHRVSPLVYHHLSAHSRQVVGEVPHLAALRTDFSRSLQTVRRQELETADLLRRLADAGVECVLLKGADLRHRLYPEPATRPMGDLDLLIPPAQLAPARRVMAELGYTPFQWTPELAPGYLERFDHELGLDPPPDRELVVDLHWEIREVGFLYSLPYDDLRPSCLGPVRGGVPVLVLSPEHLLIHLCLHTYDEINTTGLLKLLDLALAAASPELDWRRFLEEVARLGVGGGVFIMLREMAPLLPQGLPPEVGAAIAAYRPRRLEALALRPGVLGQAAGQAAFLLGHLHPRDWPRYLGPRLWPHRDYLTANLGRPDRLAYFRRFLKNLLS
ncbi:MAG: nucleotidyltransferase family protein [Deltaproteobacteria bacterium]|nr:nucleotidyltransferase family protein [Deltaproteobacteria bacterium]